MGKNAAETVAGDAQQGERDRGAGYSGSYASTEQPQAAGKAAASE